MWIRIWSSPRYGTDAVVYVVRGRGKFTLCVTFVWMEIDYIFDLEERTIGYKDQA